MNDKLIIGVDIGGTRTKSGLVNIHTGEVLHSIVQPTEKNEQAVFLDRLGSVIEELKAMADKNGTRIDGIGIGVPGFTGLNGMVITTYGFLAFMENYPLSNIVQEKFSLPCLLDNDARAIALGEAWYGKGKNYRRVLTLTLGTGVGIGFVVNGRFTDPLPLGHMGGNMRITDKGGECYCGKTGCLEALVSASGILNLAKEKPGLQEYLSVETLFAAATQGNAGALQIIMQVTAYLHDAIHNYTNLFAPDIIVLGGGIAKGLTPYLSAIKGKMYMGPYPGYDFQLEVSALEESAGMLGSAALFQLTAAK